MMDKFAFETDPDTYKMLEIVVWCLQRYFGHDEQQAVELINRFRVDHPEYDDSAYFDQGIYRSALRVHYFESLQGDWSSFAEFAADNHYQNPPWEVQEYFNEIFFEGKKKPDILKKRNWP